MVICEGVQAGVRTAGDSKAFDVEMGLHQRSVLSSLVFVIVMGVITKSYDWDCHGIYYMQSV